MPLLDYEQWKIINGRNEILEEESLEAAPNNVEVSNAESYGSAEDPDPDPRSQEELLKYQAHEDILRHKYLKFKWQQEALSYSWANFERIEV